MEIIIRSTLKDEKIVKRIRKDDAWIGRRDDCDIHLDNVFVSKTHARVTKEGENYFVETFGLNGTFLNNIDMESGKKYRLKPNDRIKIAEYEIYVVFGTGAADSSPVKHAEMMRKVVELESRIHSQLLQRMDLRNIQLLSDYSKHAQSIARHLETTLEEQADMLDPDLRDFVVRLALKRELLTIIDATGQKPLTSPSPGNGEQGEIAIRKFEEGIREVVSRLIRQMGLRLQKEHRKRDMDLLDNDFEENFEKIKVSISTPLAKYIVKRWLRKELKDIIFGLGPLQDLINMSSISEVMVVNKDQIYVEQNGVIEDSGRSFLSNDMIISVLERIVSPLGRRIDRSSPLVDARLPDGSRVNAIIPPLAVKGPCITIRKFSSRPLTIEDLVDNGTLSYEAANFLKACVVGRMNIIVSGGTASGKTTLLNVLSSFVPPVERIVTIEDAAELQLYQDHVVTLETRPANVEGAGAYTIRDLVRNALRMRPDRIIVGECRGGEALDMLQAMNTGHDGSMTTGHANSPHDIMLRIETMVLMAVDMPVRAIREQIVSALDVVVQMQRFANGERKVTQITEVVGLDEEAGVIILEDIFQYKSVEGAGKEKLVHTGYIPTFTENLIEKDILSLESLFH